MVSDEPKTKIMRLLASRKFWASVVGVLAAVGLVAFSDSQQADLVAALVTVATMAAYIMGVAVEDSGQAQAAAAITAAMNAPPTVEIAIPQESTATITPTYESERGAVPNGR